MGPAWYNPKNIIEILRAVIDDEETDGVVFLAMYASANLKLAEGMVEYIKDINPFQKPVIACFPAPPGIWDEPIKELDRKKGVAILRTPERAVKAMAHLWKVNLLMNGKGQ
jgi:acyl-CoA synthetase (NDP forming)